MDREPLQHGHVCRAYLVTNIRNGKQYIGIIGKSEKTVSKRWKEHCYEAGYNSHYLLHKAIRKYGEAAFEVEQVASARSPEDILAVERLPSSKCISAASLRIVSGDHLQTPQ
jgi:hypothetical protein